MSDIGWATIFGLGVISCTALVICVTNICNAWQHKYIWMYEGHEEREDRYMHDKEMEGKK